MGLLVRLSCNYDLLFSGLVWRIMLIFLLFLFFSSSFILQLSVTLLHQTTVLLHLCFSHVMWRSSGYTILRNWDNFVLCYLCSARVAVFMFLFLEREYEAYKILGSLCYFYQGVHFGLVFWYASIKNVTVLLALLSWIGFSRIVCLFLDYWI